MYVCMYIYIHMNIHVYLHICLCICIHKHMYTHTHTHIHTYIELRKRLIFFTYPRLRDGGAIAQIHRVISVRIARAICDLKALILTRKWLI